MKRSLIFLFILVLAFPAGVLAQQGAAGVRDYVGLINQTYHPGIVSYFEKAKDRLSKQGETNAVRNIDQFLSGAFGSGFLYNDARGNLFVLTNNHVIAQAHTLSITFERADGSKVTIENLSIIAVDEEKDIAILALPQGARPPVTRGLTLVTRAIQEGEDVFSAGFPGLGRTAIWQFGRGMVSNASVRFPKSRDDETMMGPYIQHTAQIDAGNSGGPLLVTQANAPSGYAVAGMNTLSGVNRQAANYAIPASVLQTFINNSQNQRPETYKDALDTRLETFIEGLGVNRAVFPHITEFLSTDCIGENAEYAMDIMFEKATRTVIRSFIDKAEESIISAMALSVAWLIEDSVRGTGAIRASVKEVTGEGEEYTVIFTINNRDVESVWVREYGNWRIRKFGTVAAGDQTLLSKRQSQREADANLRTDGDLFIEAGYGYLFDKSPYSLYASITIWFMSINFYFVDSDNWSIGAGFGKHFGIPVKNVGIIPFFKAGMGVINDSEPKRTTPASPWENNNDFGFDFYFSLFGQAGVKVTTNHVPGLFLGAAFQYNASFSQEDYINPFIQGLTFSVGYTY
ncbi:MAG: serine protease [Treponema sp.]|nr:serine protease [Treponema sp.]